MHLTYSIYREEALAMPSLVISFLKRIDRLTNQ